MILEISLLAGTFIILSKKLEMGSFDILFAGIPALVLRYGFGINYRLAIIIWLVLALSFGLGRMKRRKDDKEFWGKHNEY